MIPDYPEGDLWQVLHDFVAQPRLSPVLSYKPSNAGGTILTLNGHPIGGILKLKITWESNPPGTPPLTPNMGTISLQLRTRRIGLVSLKDRT